MAIVKENRIKELCQAYVEDLSDAQALYGKIRDLIPHAVAYRVILVYQNEKSTRMETASVIASSEAEALGLAIKQHDPTTQGRYGLILKDVYCQN